MLDITDPRIIRFLTESYTTESKLRIKWFNVNAEKLYQAAGKGIELKNITTEHVFTANLLPGVEALRISHVESKINRRQVPIRDAREIHGIDNMRNTQTLKDVGLAIEPDARLDRPDTDLSLDPIMRPVPEHENEVIYKSKPEFGREEYLRRRFRIIPQNKFYFNECVNWDYGWRLGDSRNPGISRQGPNLGRYWALARDARSRSGPQPDPAHYNPPMAQPNFCAIINE